MTNPIPPDHCKNCIWRSNPAFKQATASELVTIESQRTGGRHVLRGKMVVAEHKLTADLFTLYSGWGFRFKTLEDGRRQILNFLLPGDLIGLQGEFTDEATHGVEALTDLHLCVFKRDALWEMFSAQPALAYDITWLSASQEQLIDENLLTVGRRNATERVAMLLVHLWRRCESLGLLDAQGSAEFPLTQQHIADALGLSLVHTNKTLRRLEQYGLHRIAGGRLRVADAQALERIAEYDPPQMRPKPLI